MQVFISISVKLAFKPALLWGWKFSNVKTVLHVRCKISDVRKSAKKFKNYLKYIIVCLCSSNTELLNIFYQSIYFMDGFTF